MKQIDGVQRLTVSHDPTCPVLTGKLSGTHDTLRAAMASGERVAVVTPEGIFMFLGGGDD
ncbi:hypothetical protein [Streptomyces gobiensis]|uniref:hypothetical protein n=1 Tax=Streptomyces gobiensis TaxID=2875706 RepID=UPI001E6507D7|nr:hypothetical protein [Streptomyces gobiensis]UGY93410.1 hypothetical protein test1122_17935 [Streptomyces gobiensis]